MLDKNFENFDPLGDSQIPLGGDNSGEWSDDEEEENCPYAEALTSMAFLPKPFGVVWPKEKIEKFLRGRGYKIIERFDEEEEEEYTVAIKPGQKKIPDESNLLSVFEDELQEILIAWLLRLGKEES